MAGKFYNIPATVSFLDTLSSRLLAEYKNNLLGLSDVLILVANRREEVSLKEAFIRKQGMTPTILPRIIPMGDLEEDEIFLTSENEEESFLPAISKTERLLLFTKIIVSKPSDFGISEFSLAKAFSLAQELADLVDEVKNEQRNFSDLENLVPEEYAAHWQETLKFLKIITSYWPQILKDRNFSDIAEKHNRLIHLKNEQWQKEKPQTHIIAAGIYADYPEIKSLLKTVYNLSHGEIYIGGLDRNLDDRDWNNIEESHPQYQLKRLLEHIGINREDVIDCEKSKNPERERFVSEVMRPAKTTDKWLHLKDNSFSKAAFEGLRFAECESLQQEALMIAMIMREWIEEKEVRAALVSPDRNLSRMVAAELLRWGINVDDTAGSPLNRQPVSIYLRQIYSVAEQNFAPVEFLALLKNPFCRCGEDVFEFRKKVRDYEMYVLRKNGKDDYKELDAWAEGIKEKFTPLITLLKQQRIDLKELIKAHLNVAQTIADSKEENGDVCLWKGESGKLCAGFFADLLDFADIIGSTDKDEYLDFIENMMSSTMVRKQYGTHPRLKIMGPLEARLNDYDLVIIAEANEGTWPPAFGADPWMSRSMKSKFKLPLPEKKSGVFAFDFANLLSQRNVYVTRAKRINGAPVNESRWLLRIMTVLQASGKNIDAISENEYAQWAKLLDESKNRNFITAPAPCPPLKYRPRKLSASDLSALVDNPYTIYAKKILKLCPLEDLEKEMNAADFGSIVHEMLEDFSRENPHELPENAKEIMIDLGKRIFEEKNIDEDKMLFWKSRFKNIINWVLAKEKEERVALKNIVPEEEGEMSLVLPEGKFLLKAKADRIDEFADGSANIIDYKTGSAPSAKAVCAYKAPQLLLEALIMLEGGFKNVSAESVRSLKYWKLCDSIIEVKNKDLDEILKNGKQKIIDILSKYDFKDMPYEVNPTPKYCKNKDYDHLSRIAEWGVNIQEEEGFDND